MIKMTITCDEYSCNKIIDILTYNYNGVLPYIAEKNYYNCYDVNIKKEFDTAEDIDNFQDNLTYFLEDISSLNLRVACRIFENCWNIESLVTTEHDLNNFFTSVKLEFTRTLPKTGLTNTYKVDNEAAPSYDPFNNNIYKDKYYDRNIEGYTGLKNDDCIKLNYWFDDDIIPYNYNGINIKKIISECIENKRNINSLIVESDETLLDLVVNTGKIVGGLVGTTIKKGVEVYKEKQKHDSNIDHDAYTELVDLVKDAKTNPESYIEAVKKVNSLDYETYKNKKTKLQKELQKIRKEASDEYKERIKSVRQSK